MKKKVVKKRSVKKVAKKALKKPSYETLERKIRSLTKKVSELEKAKPGNVLTRKAIDLFRDLHGFVNMDAVDSIVEDCVHPEVDPSTSWLDIKQLIADYNDEDYANG